MIRIEDGFAPIPREVEEVGKMVVDAIYALHKNLGPGALEKVYQLCLAHELSKRGLRFAMEVRQPIRYDGLTFEAGYRIDFLVESSVIIEVKAVSFLNPTHRAQVLNYLKLSGKRLGFLVNFNALTIKTGLRRLIL